MHLQKKFHKVLLEASFIPKGSRLLVAVSGGADSVALLHLLNSCADEMELSLVAAHLDHALRAESADDALFVEELCSGLGLPAVLARSDVAGIAAERKGNLEEVAREVRRDFLLDAAKDHGCDLIALGQHADDQAETFLLHLLRGAGSGGLAGMRPVNGKIVRPLLSFRRLELVEYLRVNGLEWREDASNMDMRFTRNRIRHELLPLLESFNPNASGQLSATCELLLQDEMFLSGLAAEKLQECCRSVDGGMSLSLKALQGLPPALSGRVIRQALQGVRGSLRGVSSVHINDIRSLADNGPAQGELDLPGAWVARRYSEVLILRQRPPLPAVFEAVLQGVGSYDLPGGYTLVLSLEKTSSDTHIDAVEFSAEKVRFPLTVRHCRPGDRIRPSGMQGSKKLQDLFVDLKLSREDRQNRLLLTCGNEVLWVAGLRRCEGRWPVAGKEVLRVVLKASIPS